MTIQKIPALIPLATMKRWSIRQKKYVENPAVDAFLDEIVAVSRKHSLCLVHEDDQGAFIVTDLDEESLGWLAEAHDDT